MKKKLLILFTLMIVLTMALTITATCFAEEESVDNVVYENETLVDNSVDTTQSEETSDNNANLWFKTTWEKVKERVLGIVDGITIGSIVAIIVGVIIRRGTNKGFDLIEKTHNSNIIADLTSEKISKNMSGTVLDVNVKPLMEHEYRKMSAEIHADMKKENDLLKKMIYANIDCLEKLGGYFNCSVAISDEAKKEYQDTIAKSKALFDEPSTEVKATIEIVAEAPKETKKETKVVENY